MKHDDWLEAARALRDAVAGHPAVAGFSRAGRYETRGRGRTVKGVALRVDEEGVAAYLGVLLLAPEALARPITQVVGEIRVAAARRWAELAPDQDLVVHVDVVDLMPERSRQR